MKKKGMEVSYGPTGPAALRIWVDTRQRIVSFHPVEGFEQLEFRDRELFFRCVDEYTRQRYRYQ